MSEQHRLEIVVDAGGAEQGLRRYDRAVSAAQATTQRFEKSAVTAFSALDRMSKVGGLGFLDRQMSSLNDNYRKLDSMSGSAFKRTEKDALAAAASVTKLATTIATLNVKSTGGLNNLNSSLEKLSRIKVDSGLAANVLSLSKALRSLPTIAESKIQGIQAIAPALKSLASTNLPASLAAGMTAIGKALNAVSDAKVVALQRLAPAIQGMSGLTMPATIAPMLTALGAALRSLPAVGDNRINGLKSLVPILNGFSGVRIPPNIGATLMALGHGLSAIPKMNPSTVANLGKFIDNLKNMPDISRYAPGLVAMGQALGGFQLRGPSVSALGRLLAVLSTANPGQIIAVAAALRQVASSGIGGMLGGNGRFTIRPTINTGGAFSNFGGGGGRNSGGNGNGSNGNGGSGSSFSYFGNRQSTASTPRALPAPVSPLAATGLGATLGVAGAVAGVKSLSDNILEAGRSYEKFRTQIMVTARAAGETDKEWAFIQQQADKLGLSLEAMIGSYGKFSATVKQSGYSMEEVQTTFAGFAVGFKAMGMNSDQVKLSLKALEQMFSKGKVGAEELRQQLGDHMPGAVRLFADALGVSTAKLDEMMKKGEVGPDAVIKAGALAAKIYGSALSYSMNTADTAVQRFTNSMTKLKIAVWEGGFAQGIKEMFDKINGALTDTAMKGQVNALGTSFRSLFSALGDGAVWAIKNIEGVKLAFVTFFGLIAARAGLGMFSWLLALGPMLGGVAKGVLTLGGSFSGLGAALARGGIGAALVVLVSGVGMFLAKAALLYTTFQTISGWMKSGTGDMVDWQNGLVRIGDQQYTFGQTAQASWMTIRSYGVDAWQGISAASDLAWSLMQQKSAEGGGGVTGFLKQIAIDGKNAFADLFPSVVETVEKIVDFLFGNGQGPIAKAYRDAFNKAIDVVKMATSIILALIESSFARLGTFLSGSKEIIAGIATGDGNRAFAGSQEASRSVFGMGQEKSTIDRINERNAGFQFGADHLKNASVATKDALKSGATAVEEAARSFEKGVTATVSPGGSFAEAFTAAVADAFARLQQNLNQVAPLGAGAAGGGIGGGTNFSSANVANMPNGKFGIAGPEPVGASGRKVVNWANTSNAGDPRSPGWAQNNLASIKTSSGKSVQVLAAAAADYQNFLNELEATGYKIKSIGGHNVRQKAGGGGMSQHSWGNAIDINPAQNPYSQKFITDMPGNIREIAARNNLSWGGDWKSVKDTMHFEWMGPKNGGAANSNLPSWQQSQKQNERKVEELSAGRPIEKTPPKFEWKDLSYEQYQRLMPLVEKRLETTGKTKLEEQDMVELLKEAGIDTKNVWEMEQSRLASEKRLNEMSEKDREIALEHQKKLNQFGQEGLFVTKQQSDQLKGQISDLATQAELKKEGAQWEAKFKARRDKSDLTPSLNDWDRMKASGKQDSVSGALKSATDSKDGVAMAAAMKDMREKMYGSGEPYDRMIDALESEMKLTGMTNQARAVEQTLLEKKNELLKEGVVLTGDQEAKMRGTIEKLEQLKAGGTNGFASWMRSTEDFGVAIAKVEKEAIDGLIDKMSDMVVSGKADFAALGQSILKEITKIVMSSLMKQFIGMLGLDKGGGIFGSLFGQGGGIGGLFGGGGSSSTSSGGGMFSGIGNMFSGITKIFGFKEGGLTSAPVNSYNVGMGAFAGAPHYAEGIENTSGGRPAILHDDEAVIPLSRGREIPVRLTGNDSSANDNAGNTYNSVSMTIVTPDASSFGKSQRQTKREMSNGLQVAAARS